MNASHLTLLIFVLGLATVMLSGFVAYRFWWHHRNLTGDGKNLSVALFAQLVGEAIIGAVTLVFAAMAWSGKLASVAVEYQSALRFIAFAATSLTTLHLSIVVERMHKS